MSSANLGRDETAHRAAHIRLHTIEVHLDVRTALEPSVQTFPTRSTLTFDADVDETWIDFIGSAVHEVVVNGESRPVRWDGARVQVDGLAAHNVVTIRGRGRFSRSGEGLHRFTDPVDDEVYLYTQYEPADCRRVYPCFEQPDLKARWTFEVAAPEGWTVLSNTAAEASTPSDGGHIARFAETLPLSSYLTAVAAGPYHRVDGQWHDGDDRVALGVLCRRSLAAHLDAKEILDVTRSGLTFFRDAFGLSYPWGKYDQIFVPEYNLGAMENPGLVTFTEAYVFRGAATRAQHEARANTILHEMAHMWFGDLVTMRWWDDLWLKESFADYMGAHVAVAAAGFDDAWVTFANRRKAWAYQQDQLPTTHPIVADITDLEAAKLNFDGITYAKGAAVLKQLVAFVGEDAFFAGARRYFADHAYGNTTLDDLLAALEAESGRDLRAWADAWLRTTGPSMLAVERGDTVELVQTDPRPHRLRVAWYRLDAGRLHRDGDVEVDVTGERTVLDGVPCDADLILPNTGDLTYGKVRLDDGSLVAAQTALSTIDDALARAVIWSALWNATRDGELAATRYVDIVTAHAGAEPNVALLADILGNASHAVEHYVAVDDRAAMRRAWLATCAEGLRAAAPGSDAQLAWARALGSAAAVDDGEAAWLAGMLSGQTPAPEGLPLDPDLRWQWLWALAATGHADAEAAEAELRRDPTASGRTAQIAVLTARPDADVRAAAWRAAWTDDTLTNDHLDATITGIRSGTDRALVAGFDDDYFARLRDTWDARSIEIARRLVRGLFPAGDSLEPADRWLAENPDAPGALRRIVVEQRDALARDLRVRARQDALPR